LVGCKLALQAGDVEIPIEYNLSAQKLYSMADEFCCVVQVPERDRLREYLLSDYLCTFPLKLLLADGSVIIGKDWYPYQAMAYDLPSDVFADVDWLALNTDIKIEDAGMIREDDARQTFALSGKRSVLDAMKHHLSSHFPQSLVFSDHHSNEIADLVRLSRNPDGRLDVAFYHCKASSDSSAGARVGDLYELVGQAQKSIRWIQKTTLFETIRSRIAGSDIVCGSIADLDDLLDGASPMLARYFVHIVQPGLSISSVQQRQAEQAQAIRLLLQSIYDSLANLNAHLIIIGDQ